VADASMRYIPEGVVRAESWKMSRDSEVLTTVYTCCGQSCRSARRRLQFGRAAECLEHLASCEQFRFLPCPVVGCGEWIWDARLQDHCTLAHPKAKGATKKQQGQGATHRKPQTKQRKGTKAARQAEAAAAPNGINVRTSGWTKVSSVVSDSGVSSEGTPSSSVGGSPAVRRRQPAPKVTEIRRKVLAWDEVTMAARAAPIVSKTHYCLHAECMTSTRGFKSAAAVKDHAAAAHKA
jgi:hypothetical protein